MENTKCHIFMRNTRERKLFFDLDGNLLEGSIPIKQKKYMLAWIAIHEEDLKANWELLQSGQEFFRIPPLQ